ncbi:MAG: hypothetical protein ABW202_11015 [Duganella sp.]
MKKLLATALASTALLSWTYASEIANWDGKYRPLKASYLVYSSTPGEKAAPTTSDRKIAITIEGSAAKEIFDSLYPDATVTCSDEKGERLRSKGEVWCSYTPSAKYRCFVGFDLRTGKSYSGASC